MSFRLPYRRYRLGSLGEIVPVGIFRWNGTGWDLWVEWYWLGSLGGMVSVYFVDIGWYLWAKW
ncbi:hypothetical protein RhiirA4_477969 [Rhizophagus irregularis]|uniref:Uncharacterized protein n=1 Tax=Rhizophagus irregularis TaxID=588596 RepID=A0A2I1HE17_9GLOM|nr:hypothetical protein RhiirA4_477969 [Rhizophagus irregularis]